MLQSSRPMRGVVTLLTLAACSGSGGGPTGFTDTTFDAPWPSDMAAVLTTVYEDGAGDQEALPPSQDGPPYAGPVSYPPVDVTRIALGVDGRFLYMRVEYAGRIPTTPVEIAPAGEVERQWVLNQGMNIALDADGDPATGGGGEGVSGIDIFFAVGVTYADRVQVYANWDFPTGDLHEAGGSMDGELGAGGPGFDYVLVRYDVRDLGAFFPRGATVNIGSWSEAESYDGPAGTLKYHHFAFDRVIDGEIWAIPQ